MKASKVIRALRSRPFELRQSFTQNGRRDIYTYHEVNRNTLETIADNEQQRKDWFINISRITLNFRNNKLRRTIVILHDGNNERSLNINQISRMRFINY